MEHISNTPLLELFFSQSLDGFFFMMLDEPLRWDDSVDKEKALDYVFEHQRVTKVNDAMLAQYGATAEQFTGLTPNDLYAHDIEYGRAVWREFFDAGRLHVETNERKLDGTPIWIEGDYICFYDEQGRITGHFGIQRDITDRKQAEEALRQYNKRLETLQKIARDILAARSPEETGRAVMQHIHDLLPCRRASVAEFDWGSQNAVLIATHTQGNTRLGPGAQLPIKIFGDIDRLRQGKVHEIEDTRNGSAEMEPLRAEGVRSYMNVPLIARDELIGVLNIGSETAGRFSKEHIEIAREAADSLAVALRQARLHEQVERHSAELEQRVAERTAQLQESEKRYRSLYNSTPVMMHSINSESILTSVNDFWIRNLGYSRKEVIGRPVTDFLTAISRRFALEKGFPSLREKGFIRDIEVQFVKKNGEVIDVQVSAIAKKDERGNFLSANAFLLDVTEKKRAENALRESEERLRAIGNALPDLVFVMDEEGCFQEILTGEPNLLYTEREKLKGQRITGLFPNATADLFMGAIQRTIQTRQSELLEYKLNVPAGERWFEGRTAFLNMKINGKQCMVFIARDITDRIRAEDLENQNIYLQEEIRSEFNFGEIIGASNAMKGVFQSIEMVAATDSTALLLGETGTGKELIARAIHNRSGRKDHVMIKVNCGAMPAGLVESELFGHEKGAFTGATVQKKGKFELAHNGTIFLDEIGELPHDTQVKLLRVLQEQEFERVGGAKTLKVDVRIIAATNRDLQKAAQEGNFRADLFYRLNIFPIQVPPLRERKEDIPLLVNYLIGKFSDRMGKHIKGINQKALQRLMRYHWPGNVRELANVLERAVILCQGSTLQEEHIGRIGDSKPVEDDLMTLEDAERRHILRVLEKTGGVLAGPKGAAAILGVNRSTLWSRMRKLGINISRQVSGD